MLEGGGNGRCGQRVQTSSYRGVSDRDRMHSMGTLANSTVCVAYLKVAKRVNVNISP